MPIAPARKKLFDTPAEISTRDHGLRLMRRPQRVEQLHTTRGDEAYGLTENVYFSESATGAPLPIKATLECNGGPRMSQSLERRITADDKPAPRDYVTVPELATLLDVSETTVTRAMTKAGLEMYRPGGEFGRRRIRRAVVEAFIQRSSFDEAHRAVIMQQVEEIMRGQVTA